VVSRINRWPDMNAAAFVPSRSYWIADNYGANQIFSLPDSMNFQGYGNITPADAAVPSQFKLYFRESNGDSATWFPVSDSANVVTAGTDGDVHFHPPVSVLVFGQFQILNHGAPDAVDNLNPSENFSGDAVVYPNPSAQNGTIVIETTLTEELLLSVFDAAGNEVLKKNFSGSAEISANSFSAGTYFYSARGKTSFRSGSFVVE
jgi:hypothetical protein